MNVQFLEVMPGVQRAILNCEKEICRITGQVVRLNIDNKPLYLSTEKLILIVCEHFKIQRIHLLGQRRDKDIVKARHVFAYIARVHLKMTMQSVADTLHKDNHTTILHACRTVKNLIEIGDSIITDLREISDKLNSNNNETETN